MNVEPTDSAFPVAFEDARGDSTVQQGMDVRTHMAVQMMAHLIPQVRPMWDPAETKKALVDLAKMAVMGADTLLEELNWPTP